MRPTINNIMSEVAEEFGVSVSVITARPRGRFHGSKRTATIRQRAMFRVFSECPHISYPEMGRRMGGFDHTSCLHNVRKYCSDHGLSYDALAAHRAFKGGHPGSRKSVLDRLFEGYSETMETAYAAG